MDYESEIRCLHSGYKDPLGDIKTGSSLCRSRGEGREEREVREVRSTTKPVNVNGNGCQCPAATRRMP